MPQCFKGETLNNIFLFMDVALSNFMKTCASRSLEGIVDILSWKIMLKMWNCNLMTGEWHGLTGEELFCDLNGLLLKLCVFVCHMT